MPFSDEFDLDLVTFGRQRKQAKINPYTEVF